MAETFTGKILILAAILGSWLPTVTPIDYNTCTGGLLAQTCQVKYSSHCCMSGTYLSASCCRNSCIYSSRSWYLRGWHASTSTCYDITDSMCCSTEYSGSESCCDFASYSRTFTSSINGDYDRPTYAACSAGFRLTEFCTNSHSPACCSDDYFATASCCRPSTCRSGRYVETCRRTSSYCCSSAAQSCCDISDYNYERSEKAKNDGAKTGWLVGGIIFLFVIIIVVPVAMICHYKRRRGQDQADRTAVSVTAASNHARPHHPAFQQSTCRNQPPPSGHRQPPPSSFNQQSTYRNQSPSRQPPSSRRFNQQPANGSQPPPCEHRHPQSFGLDQLPANGNQPPSNEHHQPPSSALDQPPAYGNQPPPSEHRQTPSYRVDQPLAYGNQPPPYEHHQPPPSAIDQPPAYGNQPPPYEHRQPPSSGLDQPPSNGNQPPSNEHHQPPSSGLDQPPAYEGLPQFQSPSASPPQQPGPTPVVHCPSSNPDQPWAANKPALSGARMD